MGLFFSSILAYAGTLEAIECAKFIVAGMLPDNEPDFQDLKVYYTRLMKTIADPSTSDEWTTAGGQGYLCLTEDKNGDLKSASIKYYDGSHPDSTAILFSTKISSFGQESCDSNSQANGDYDKAKSERYTPTPTTKTLISNTSESVNIGQRNRSTSPSYEKISDPNRFSPSSFERNEDETPIVDEEDRYDSKEKLKWHYRPLSPAPQALPEIQFHSSEEKADDPAYSEDFLRSLDGIKYRPLTRSDPSGRRRSYKKRHSSSSTSSRESRASREEELKLFTSLEEAELERMGPDEAPRSPGTNTNLQAHSYSRSRSRESSKERRHDNWSVEGSFDSAPDEASELKPKLKDLPKLGSFEEERPEDTTETKTEVMAEEEEEIDDFWGTGD